MRIYKKQELVEFVQSLKKVNQMFTEKPGKYDSIFGELLEDCQQIAIKMGTDLEKGKEDNHYVVSLLEKYCEVLYEMSICFQSENEFLYCQEQVDDLLDRILINLPEDPKIIVFLPYKASMWDSLESIWMAAEQDKRCICIVLPIPYFDRNPDGKLGIMHYEGDQFPSYVPVTDWQQWDLEVLQPDIIYIHNPFDGNNFVTCVHPAYFSEKLGKYTRKLVYVPYFFTNEKLAETHLALPSYSNIDVIIAQNEVSRQQLIKDVATKKVKVFGSPKLDRLLRLQKQKGCPENLKNYVGKKKIVLFNTSISLFLKNSYKMLDKIEEVLDSLKDKKDILLVWRPHPLLEATVKAMRGELYQRYLALKERFIKTEIGLWDEDMDLDELVVAADAYIGEASSSVVVLFASLGKPIFLIDTENRKSLPESYAFFDFWQKGDKMVFAHAECEAICMADMKEEIVEDVIFPTEEGERYKIRPYTDIVETREYLYFTPMTADKILKLHKQSGEVQKINFGSKTWSNFCRAFSRENDIYFVPTEHEAIVRYSENTGKLKNLTEPILHIKQASMEEGFFSMFASCLVENKLYIASPTNNCIVIYDTISSTVEEYDIGEENLGYWDMIYDGSDIWLNPYKGRAIVRWNPTKNIVHKYSVYPENFSSENEEGDLFIRLVDCDTFVLAFPKKSNMIIEIDKAKGTMKEFDLNLPYREGERKGEAYKWQSNYYFAKRQGDKVYALTAYDNGLLIIDIKVRTCVIKHFKPDKKVLEQMKKEAFVKSNGKTFEDYLYAENQWRSVDDFLQALQDETVGYSEQEKNLFLSKMANADGTAGFKIHSAMMEEL